MKNEKMVREFYERMLNGKEVNVGGDSLGTFTFKVLSIDCEGYATLQNTEGGEAGVWTVKVNLFTQTWDTVDGEEGVIWY